jgi:hypothetical protein
MDGGDNLLTVLNDPSAQIGNLKSIDTAVLGAFKAGIEAGKQEPRSKVASHVHRVACCNHHHPRTNFDLLICSQ